MLFRGPAGSVPEVESQPRDALAARQAIPSCTASVTDDLAAYGAGSDQVVEDIARIVVQYALWSARRWPDSAARRLPRARYGTPYVSSRP